MMAKKAYIAPKLIVYGDVRQLTRALAHFNPNKDGGPNNTKT
jgi:hypothetical protein